MISYISAPVASSIGLRPGYFAGNFLSAEHDPLQIDGAPNKDNFPVGKFALPKEITVEQLEDRQHLLATFDQFGIPPLLQIKKFFRVALCRPLALTPHRYPK